MSNQNQISDSHASLFVIDRRDFDPKNYWYIHGKYYNLTNYMEKHPGGKFILEKTKGQGDLSALYESYHAFSNIDNIDKYLKTFEVKFKVPNQNQHEYKTDNYNIIYVPKNNIYDAYLNIAESFETQKDQDTDSEIEQDIISETEPQQQPQQETEEIQNETQFDFTNYRILAKQAKQLFPTREDIKANHEWHALVIIMFFTFFYGFYNGLFSSPQALLQKFAFLLPFLSNPLKIALLRVFFITLASASWAGLKYNVMHDGSHYAITTDPNINYYATKTYNALNGWNALLWFYHHVQHHHSYTGIETQDPDYYLYHPLQFTAYEKTNWLNATLKKIHPYLCPFIFIIFPGQDVGQGLLYLQGSFQRRLWNFKLPDEKHIPEFYDTYDISFFFLALLAYENVILLGNGYWLFLYFTQLNFFYMFNVIFDHDLFENAVENKYHGKDWVKLQISHSGNFCNGNQFWTKWFGGINYQIEHHLFPNMSNSNYPIISPLVQDYCQTNRIPYVHQPTFKDAIVSFTKTIFWHSITDEDKRK